MNHPPMVSPWLDPTAIFELFRGNYATELLTAAVAHFRVFERLRERARWRSRRSGGQLGLSERPAVVLDDGAPGDGPADGRRGGPDRADRPGPRAPDARGVLRRQRLHRPGRRRARGARDGRAAADEPPARGGRRPRAGAAFIFKEGIESAMEREASARRLTLALAGRARNVAPVLAEKYPLDGARLLLDVGGGTGIYASPGSSATPSSARSSGTGPRSSRSPARWPRRTASPTGWSCMAGDMFRDPVPDGRRRDPALEHPARLGRARVLDARLACAARPADAAGKLLIHDVFLERRPRRPAADRPLLGRALPADRGPGLQRGGVPRLAPRRRVRRRRGRADAGPLRRPAGDQGEATAAWIGEWA